MRLGDIIQIANEGGCYRAKVVSMIVKNDVPVRCECELIEGPQDGIHVSVEVQDE